MLLLLRKGPKQPKVYSKIKLIEWAITKSAVVDSVTKLYFKNKCHKYVF